VRSLRRPNHDIARFDLSAVRPLPRLFAFALTAPDRLMVLDQIHKFDEAVTQLPQGAVGASNSDAAVSTSA